MVYSELSSRGEVEMIFEGTQHLTTTSYINNPPNTCAIHPNTSESHLMHQLHAFIFSLCCSFSINRSQHAGLHVTTDDGRFTGGEREA